MSIKISQLPPKIGNSGISTGDIPISIAGVTYRVNPSQLLTGTTVSGIGTANFVTKWNGTSSLTNSQIYDNGLNVLINSIIDNSVDKLQVNGSILSTAFKKSGGTASQFLMADGSVTSTANFTFTGTTNFHQKVNASSALTNSLIYDNGDNIGFSTTNLTGDTFFTLGSQFDRKIGIEDTLSGLGKNLTIKASTALSAPLIQSFNVHLDTGYVPSANDLTITPNGDVYVASSSGGSAGVWKKPFGSSAYTQIYSGSSFYFITHKSNNILFASNQTTGDVYMSVNSGVSFTLANSGLTTASAIYYANSNSTLYVAAGNLLYTSTDSGSTLNLHTTFGPGSFIIRSIAENNNDIYLGITHQDVYKQTGGTGSFSAQSIGSYYYNGLDFLGNDMFWTDEDNDAILYKPFGGSITLIPAPALLFTALQFAPNGDMYLIKFPGLTNTIYVSNAIDAKGGKLILEAGSGAGLGTTSIDFNLPLITTPNTVQTKGTLMSLANNGDLLLNGKYIKSGGTASQFLMADGSVSTMSSLNTITGAGSPNRLSKFSGTSVLTDSNISDSGTLVSVSSNMEITASLTANTIHVTGMTIGDAPLNEDLQHMANASVSTGLYEFTNGGITSTGGTIFNIGAVKGWIVNPLDILDTNPIFINYSGASGLTTPYILSSPASYFLINTASTLTILSTRPTVTDRRNMIFLGVIGHPNGVITGVGNSPDIIMNEMSQVRAMFEPTRLINEGVSTYPNSTNMTLANTGGLLYGFGIGFVTNGNLAPSVINIAGGAPTTFQYRTQTGQTFANTTLISGGTYDLNGVATAIPGPNATATNQRAYLLQNGTIRIQFGQMLYATLTDAISAAANEPFVPFANAKLGILVGIICVTKGCTNLADTTTARFLNVSKFGETVGAAGGIAVGTLQTSYNNSSDPEVLTNSVLGALTVKRGSAADTDNIFQGLNGAGLSTFSVLGNGNVGIGNVGSSTIPLRVSGAAGTQVAVDTNGAVSRLELSITGTSKGRIQYDTTNGMLVGTNLNSPLIFITDNSLRGRVTGGNGRLLWNTAVDNGVDMVQVDGNIRATTAKLDPTDTSGPVVIQNARASNSSNIQEWKNITGGTTADIDGNGFLNLQRVLAISTTNDALVGFSSGGSGLVAIGQNIGAAGAVIQNTAGGNLAVFDNTDGNTVTIDNNAVISATTFVSSGRTNQDFLMGDGTFTSYKEYVAVFNTTGTTVQVIPLGNTIGNIVWTNIGTGRFWGTLTGAFLDNKVVCYANAGNGSTIGTVNFFRNNDDTVQLNTYITTNGSLSNDIINKGSITIRIYP